MGARVRMTLCTCVAAFIWHAQTHNPAHQPEELSVAETVKVQRCQERPSADLFRRLSLLRVLAAA